MIQMAWRDEMFYGMTLHVCDRRSVAADELCFIMLHSSAKKLSPGSAS